jgi:hypothetical protein
MSQHERSTSTNLARLKSRAIWTLFAAFLGTACGGRPAPDETANLGTSRSAVGEHTFLLEFGVGSGTGHLGWIAEGIAIDSSGDVYVVGGNSGDKAVVFDTTGNYKREWTLPSSSQTQRRGIAADPLWPYVYVTRAHGVDRLSSSDGTVVNSWGSSGSGQGNFYLPLDVGVDTAGRVYVAEWGGSRAQKFYANGDFILQLASGHIDQAYGVGTYLSSGTSARVYVTSDGNHKVEIFKPDGSFVDDFGGFGTGNGQFDDPFDVCVDGSGHLYVVEFGNHRVQQFTTAGAYVAQFGNDVLTAPRYCTTDSNGNIYVTDLDTETGLGAVFKFGP